MDNKDIITNIATNLRYLRKQRHISQEQLIREIGEEKISLRSYKSYEDEFSNRIPLLNKLAIIADYYGCSIDYIVYNKDSVYTDSFSKRDNMRRLVELIYSLVLIPEKEIDQNSSNYGRYYFYSYDKDIALLIDKLNILSKEINNDFEYENKKIVGLLDRFHEMIEEFPDLKEDWSPSKNRVNQILLESGINDEEFLNNRLDVIERKRRINGMKNSKFK